MKKKQNGFTLVEVSIVLIVIGLIVGGVAAGKELIKVAEIRQLITQGSEYITATSTFRIKYKYFPGDQPNATDYGFSVPDGDGNNIIRYTTPSGTCNETGEHQWAWVALSESGIIKEPYTYVLNNPVVGVNVPSAMGGKASFALSQLEGVSVVGSLNHKYADHNAVIITNVRPNGWYRSCTTGGAGLIPIDAQTIDTKLDDGLPGSGRVMSHQGRIPAETTQYTCHTGGNILPGGIYDLTTAPNIQSCKLARIF